VGERLKDALKDPARRVELQPTLERLQRLRRRDITGFRAVDWGNARLRRLAAQTVDAGWWRLLWVPASLPYHQPTGPFAVPEVQGMTKRLVFSSWVAAPTAIASLLSYEAERQTASGVAPWQVSDAPEPYIEQMLKAIVGIEIPIARLEGKWKLSQNRPPQDRAGVIADLRGSGDPSQQALAELVAEADKELAP